jgi:hypothetical protein
MVSSIDIGSGRPRIVSRFWLHPDDEEDGDNGDGDDHQFERYSYLGEC